MRIERSWPANPIVVLEQAGDTISIPDADTTIGYLKLAEGRRSVEHMFVHPAFRRRGYAKQLLAAAEMVIGQSPLREDSLSDRARADLMWADGASPRFSD